MLAESSSRRLPGRGLRIWPWWAGRRAPFGSCGSTDRSAWVSCSAPFRFDVQSFRTSLEKPGPILAVTVRHYQCLILPSSPLPRALVRTPDLTSGMRGRLDHPGDPRIGADEGEPIA